jgi:hypothetical protein
MMNRVLPFVVVGALLAFGGVAHAAELKPGLKAEYFDRLLAITDFPAIVEGEKPDIVCVDANIDWEAGGVLPGTTIADYCYVRWTGKIRVPRDGSYTLWTASDDGSRVFINGARVVDNGGVHGVEEKSGGVELKAGDHDLKVEYFENDAGAACRFGWQGPQIEKQIVPAEVLFHEE